MKDSLADALLGKVMGWGDLDSPTVEALRRLQVMARHKYDHYERFRLGRRFIESLADWLRQFEPGRERTTAFEFIQNKLVFISNGEMEQLVGILYQKMIRPIIREHVSKTLGLPAYAVSKIERTPEFTRTRRRSLFLGLSDGARIDEFRRSNRDLSNEQVYATYEVAGPRLAEMRSQLLNDQKEDPSDPIQFELVFLLDDFAGSGKSILRERNGAFGGRLQRFSELLRMDAQEEASVFSGPQTEIHICLYVATQQAVDQLTQSIEDYTASAPWEHAPVVHAVQLLDQSLRIEPSRESGFCELLDKYYDERIEDAAKRVGGTSSKYGFAEGSLPLVLSHNTPNNSVSLLWAPSPMKALFPRFERHSETVS